jgi:hypothetical protein
MIGTSNSRRIHCLKTIFVLVCTSNSTASNANQLNHKVIGKGFGSFFNPLREKNIVGSLEGNLKASNIINHEI